MTKEKLDLGAAFKKLKNEPTRELFDTYIRVEGAKKDTGEKYAHAYGVLSAAVKAFLYVTTDIYHEDIQDALRNLEQK